MKPMKFVLGNSRNPNNGEIRDSDGVLWSLCAVMNKESERVMRAMAGAPELLAALERLSFAAECRDNTMGDACRLIEVKAELAAANKQAIAAIAKATA